MGCYLLNHPAIGGSPMENPIYNQHPVTIPNDTAIQWSGSPKMGPLGWCQMSGVMRSGGEMPGGPSARIFFWDTWWLIPLIQLIIYIYIYMIYVSIYIYICIYIYIYVYIYIYIHGGFHKWGKPAIARWFISENPNGWWLGVPLFQETSIYIYTHTLNRIFP